MKGARKAIYALAKQLGTIRSCQVVKAFPQIPQTEAARELADMAVRGKFIREKVAGVRGYVYTPVTPKSDGENRAYRPRVRALVSKYGKRGKRLKARFVLPPPKEVRLKRAEKLANKLFECAPIVRVGV